MKRNPLKGGFPKRTEHGNRPSFSTEFEKIVYNLEDFGTRNTGGHGNFDFDRYISNILK